MLGSNQCGQCTHNYIVLIIPFAVAGIALVAFIIALKLTVSVCTMNGLIFYSNVVKIFESIFFLNGPVKLLSQFISWLNLDLGIETCFFDGMGSCSKAWIFKKPPPTPVTGDAEVLLMYPGSPALVCETSSMTVVSVVMRRESLLDDEDD